MAREITTIEQEIDQAANQHHHLNALQANPSMASVWLYAKKTFALSAHGLEKIFDQLKDEITATIDTTETGSLDWYRHAVASYQHGDSLIVANNRPTYNTVDPAKRIVSKYIVVERRDEQNQYPYLWIAVAKGTAPNYTPLSVEELSGLSYYMERVKIAGTPITVVSKSAEGVTINLSVTLSPAHFSRDGKLLAEGSQEPVKNALIQYLSELSQDGVFYRAALIDRLMNIPGVVDIVIKDAPEKQFIDAGYATVINDSPITYTLLAR